MGDNASGIPPNYAPKSYALSGKIMLSAMVILFTVVLLIVCLHIYAHWFLVRARRRHHLHRRSRRAHLVFNSAVTTNNVLVPSRGLVASVLKSLPIFIYSSTTHDDVLECAVCLSEFEENEKGRLLPKCNHSFHIDCIDMWFHSHSTCPLCRVPVKPEIPAPSTETPSFVISVESAESETGSSSGLCPFCRHGEDEMGSSSSSSSFSSLGPRRNESFRGLDEELQGSPGSYGSNRREIGLCP